MSLSPLSQDDRVSLAYESVVLRFERSGRNLDLLPRLVMQTASEWFDKSERRTMYAMLLDTAKSDFTDH
jgi:hypothetical protein